MNQPTFYFEFHNLILILDCLVLLSLKLTSMFSGLGPANTLLTRQLKLKVRVSTRASSVVDPNPK
jgi:hypothetical protein